MSRDGDGVQKGRFQYVHWDGQTYRAWCKTVDILWSTAGTGVVQAPHTIGQPGVDASGESGSREFPNVMPPLRKALWNPQARWRGTIPRRTCRKHDGLWSYMGVWGGGVGGHLFVESRLYTKDEKRVQIDYPVGGSSLKLRPRFGEEF